MSPDTTTATNATTSNDYPTVATDSLPHSLRHLSRDCALDEARNLVQFVDEVLFFQSQADDGTLSQRGSLGMQLVVSLIRDKLDIASGAYHFPIASHRSNAELAKRVD